MQIFLAADDLVWKGLDADEQEQNSSLMAMTVVICRQALALFYWQQPTSESGISRFPFLSQKGDTKLTTSLTSCLLGGGLT